MLFVQFSQHSNQTLWVSMSGESEMLRGLSQAPSKTKYMLNLFKFCRQQTKLGCKVFKATYGLRAEKLNIHSNCNYVLRHCLKFSIMLNYDMIHKLFRSAPY